MSSSEITPHTNDRVRKSFSCGLFSTCFGKSCVFVCYTLEIAFIWKDEGFIAAVESSKGVCLAVIVC